MQVPPRFAVQFFFLKM